MGNKGKVRRRIVALAGLVPCLVSLPASAQSRDFGPFDVVGGGLFVGYTFGKERGVDWGIEGFSTRHFREFAECGDNARRAGFGPIVRLSMLNVSGFAFTGAGHIGGEAARSFIAGDLELGGTVALAKNEARGSIHTGLTLEAIMFNVYARQEWLLGTTSIGGGARFMPTFGLPGSCEVGRAFRDHGGGARSRATHASERFDARCPEAKRWAERSRDECSSVLAFLQLALELLDEGAPLELVARALRAAEQELSHTWDAAALAERFGGARVVPRSPTPRFRARLPRRQQLARLAHEGWVDGCLNEGVASLVAAEEARAATDGEEARVSFKIAREEAEHAALAHDVVRWVVAQDQSLLPTGREPADAAAFATSSLPAPDVHELAALQTARARERLVAA